MQVRGGFFALVIFIISNLDAYSIVFIHIGPELPIHLLTSIAQARLFNEECPIFLIANEEALRGSKLALSKYQVTFIPCESLKKSKVHLKFHKNKDHQWSHEGLWVYSSERFFYLEELIRQYELSDVFHMESDVMLYADLNDYLDVFIKRYKGMLAAIFENDNRCVPSFLYISNLEPITKLINFYPKKVYMEQSDMETLAQFKAKYHKVFIDHLPILTPEYANDHVLEAFSIQSREPECYSNNIEEFDAIFDGAAWGIYLAGWDSRWSPDLGISAISPYSVFNPSFFSLEWENDHKGRRVPFVSYKDKQFPIINLHITNKIKIPDFYSLTNMEEK